VWGLEAGSFGILEVGFKRSLKKGVDGKKIVCIIDGLS
jgi:hypothetical protein